MFIRDRAWSGRGVVGAAMMLVACGGKVTVTEGTGGAGEGGAGVTAVSATSSVGDGGATSAVSSPSSSASGGGPIGDGSDCTTDDECPEGACVETGPEGPRVCTRTVPEAMGCDPSHQGDQCCTSADCAQLGMGAVCIDNGFFPACGGPPPPPQNVCLSDICQSDETCFSGFCAPAGSFGYPGRTCVPAFCRTNADCTAAPGGFCAPIDSPCCPVREGLACVYPGGCQRSADCAEGACVLDWDQGVGRCEPNGVPCPAIR
jgi:hypothetical protein